MPHAVVLAPLILIAVLVSSAMAKWNAADSTRSALVLLRVPKPLQTALVARSVPPGELLLAAALFLPSGWPARLAALAVTGLMAIYWALIARGLTFDPRPTCGCFGRIGQNQVTERTLFRNTLLIALALGWLVATWQGRSLPSLLSDQGVAGWWWVAGAVAVSVLTYLITAPPRAKHPHADPHPQPVTAAPAERAAGDEEMDYVRAVIPDALLQQSDGDVITLRELVWERAVLLVLINCFCGPSHQVSDALQGWRERLPQLDVRLVSTAPTALTRRNLAALAEDDSVLYDHRSLTWRQLEIQSSPAAVLLGADGMLAGGPVHGVDEINEFIDDIEEVLSEQVPEEGVVVGEVLPSSEAEVEQQV